MNLDSNCLRGALILACLVLIAGGAPAAETSLAAGKLELNTDWPWWRGPHSNGVAAEGQSPPTEWDATKNVVWKAPVPGRGHSSPIVVGQRVLLTTAEGDTQSVVCFDRNSGRQLWTTEVNRGGLPKEIHGKNTHASPTLACDGQRLFAVFNNHDRAQLTALDLDGKRLWQIDAAPFRPDRYKYGYAPSPLVYKNTVIVAADYDGDGAALAAFDTASGREIWRTPRPGGTSYSSPVVARVAGREQLLVSGCDQVVSYDPASGAKLWSCAGPAKATCGTLVWEGDLVFASGGYPERQTLAVRADGSGRIVWTNRTKCYEQSLLVHDGHLYALDDGGVAYCWKAASGEVQWHSRLGGSVSASPVLAGGNLYLLNERGTVFVVQADPSELKEVARNQLGDEGFATPTIVDGQIFLRTAERQGGRRQETLYCIGQAE